MKKIIFLVSVFFIISCGQKVETPEQKEQKIAKKVNREIEYNVDKLVFISYIEKSPLSEVKSVISDYYKQYYNPDIYFDKAEDYQEIIESISNEHNLSNRKVASILFAYIYEFRTKEEIGKEYLSELIEEEDDWRYYDDPGDNYR